MTGVLGQSIAAPASYSPEILERIDRALGRSRIARVSECVSVGHDVWHCYELSWLTGAQEVRYTTGALVIPASSPYTVESKSLKLYFNSLNGHFFESDRAAIACIEGDLSALTQSEVTLHVMDAARLRDTSRLPAEIGSALTPEVPRTQLTIMGFRSLCPVTSQPDWATVMIDVSTGDFDASKIRQSVEALRNHQGFHEQCIEDLYSRLDVALNPRELRVVGFFQRRGGIDITPWRGSSPEEPSLIRLFEQ